MKKPLLYFFITLFALIIVDNQPCNAQNKSATKVKFQDMINPDNFSVQTLKDVILIEMNKYRHSKSLDTLIVNKTFEKAADDQSYYMAKKQETTLANTGKKKTTASRVSAYGGSKNVEEIVGKIAVNRGDDYFTYQKVAEDIIAIWLKNKKIEAVILNPGYIFAGLSAALDVDGKKAYISVIFGNYTSFNKGASDRKKMKLPYSTHDYGLKPYVAKPCRKCLKYTTEIEEIRKGLTVQDGKIYLKVKDVKILKKLVKNPKDAIAIDIVQNEQYPCDGENIVDFNRVNKGVLLKPIYSKSLLKLNTVKDKKSKAYEACLGRLPKGLTGDYEINLLFIQDRTVCRSISQSYTDIQKVPVDNPVKLLLDLTSVKTDSDYRPVAESSFLTFKVPFEQNKTTYKESDIEPFIKALNEPDFTINEVAIAAYSSIEGNEDYNEKLQRSRANSIIQALKSRQKDSIRTEITTDNSWDKFVDTIKGTKYEALANMTMQDANKYIYEHKWQKELEPILSKHRYAEIVLDVTYDISGTKEQAYVLNKFNKTVKQVDLPLAFAIQKYIIKCVLMKKYTSKAISDMVIPNEKIFTLLINNKLVMELLVRESDPSEDDCKTLASLLKNEPNNFSLYYNNLFCSLIHSEFSNLTQVNEMQAKIDEMYTNEKTPLALIDALNLELQFQTLRLLDSIDVPKEVLEKSFSKIKSIVKIEETGWENGLKLAYMFISHNDFEYSGALLDAFLEQDVSEEYLFTYLSLCSHSSSRIMSNKFSNAAKRAYKLNPRRFCALFKGDKFSIQVFDNPIIKEIYCKNCVK